MAASAWEKTIADAIAAKMALIDGIKATASLGTDNLPKLPGALVLSPDAEVQEQLGNYETWKATYPVYILVAKGDPKTTLALLSSLVAKVRIAWWDGIQLGLAPLVTRSYCVRYTFGPEELAGITDLPAYRVDVDVYTFEQGSRTA